MNSLVMVSLCVAAWVLTFVKLRALLLPGMSPKEKITSNVSDNDGLFLPGRRLAQNKEEIAFNVWMILLFFSITLTFMVVEIAVLVNAHTFPNLSLLISHLSFLL